MFASLVRASSLFLAALIVTGSATSQPPLPPLPPPDDSSKKVDGPQAGADGVKETAGVKVADKGPIHEAFAQPGAEVRGKGMTAPKAPPPPVNEVPPESKPEGPNVKWIPGYWQWDADRNDFIWVSGFYRNLPPNRDWEPGKWIEKDGQNVYLPGYWRPAGGGQLPTLPEPPKSIESGPSTPHTNPDAMWVPGSWEFRNDQFAWRGGYWAAPYRDMMWQPPQYVYNGANYTVVPGYWDYPLESRGLLYAPVIINKQVYQNPGFTYTPQYGIGVGDGSGYGNNGLFGQMYYGPNYNNYYYGNYGNPYGGLGNGGYGGYGGLGGMDYGMGLGFPLGLGMGYPFWGYPGLGFGGYYPWWYGGPGFYNPLWNHYNWLNRGNPGWGNGHGGRGGGNNGGGSRGGAGDRGGDRGGGTRGTHAATGAHSGIHAVGTAAGAAGSAAGTAARAAMATQSNPVVRPASQVLAAQATRASVGGLRSVGGAPVAGASGMRTYSGAGIQAGGVTIRPGITGGNFSPGGGSLGGGYLGGGYPNGGTLGGATLGGAILGRSSGPIIHSEFGNGYSSGYRGSAGGIGSAGGFRGGISRGGISGGHGGGHR